MKLHKEVTHKILKFYLLKFELNKKKGFLPKFVNFSFLSNIKKILFLILHYHKAGKDILFIGLTPRTEALVSRHTSHKAVSFNTDLKDFVSKGFYLNYLENKKVVKLTGFGGLKPDLVIVLDHTQKPLLLKECFRLKVPFAHYEPRSGLFKMNTINSNSIIESSTFSNLFFFESCLVFLIKKIFMHSSKSKLARTDSRVLRGNSI